MGGGGGGGVGFGGVHNFMTGPAPHNPNQIMTLFIALFSQMPVVCLMWLMWKVCRRNRNVHWKSMLEASTPTNPPDLANSYFVSLLSALCHLLS